MTPEELDKLEALVKAATLGPWRDEREPFPVRNPWFEKHDGAPIESRGTPFGLGVAVGVTAEPRDAAAIAALHNAAPALIAAAREVERLRAFVPRWERRSVSGTPDVAWDLRVSGLRIADATVFTAPTLGKWRTYLHDVEFTDLPTAAAAVCARLGILSVEVPS